MILLRSELFRALDTPAGLASALQTAANLEHSTIPPYFYALYSIKDQTNVEIAGRIQSVMIEEMLHMTLVCNIMNAMGTPPRLGGEDFVPKYPGPLPGGVEGGLKVRLAPFSVDLVMTVFMQIEEPERPLVFPDVVLAELADVPRTIGQFYAGLKSAITAAGDGAFAKPTNSQITKPFNGKLIAVSDVKSALAAIDLIVEQGEGAPDSPIDSVNGFDPKNFNYTQLAHYYRFAEIVHLKRLVANPNATASTPPDQRFMFGPKIPFTPLDIYGAPADPKRSDYPAGSAQRIACDKFNATYTGMLKSLNDMVNGQPNALTTALSAMDDLQDQAVDMMSGASTGGVPTGPTFEY
jgi:hypothetical protein